MALLAKVVIKKKITKLLLDYLKYIKLLQLETMPVLKDLKENIIISIMAKKLLVHKSLFLKPLDNS